MHVDFCDGLVTSLEYLRIVDVGPREEQDFLYFESAVQGEVGYWFNVLCLTLIYPLFPSISRIVQLVFSF